MSSAEKQVVGIYERHALAYDADRNRSLAAERMWLDRFLSLLPTPSTVLDLGCGHAEPIARYLIENGVAVHGVDASSSLIAICRRRFPEHQWSVADMRSIDLNERFEGLLAWDSLFHLPQRDQRRMFSLFRRHAAPRAMLLFTSGPVAGVSMGSYRGEPLFHASLAAAEYEALLDSEGFRVLDHVAEEPQSGLHTVWLAQFDSHITPW